MRFLITWIGIAAVALVVEGMVAGGVLAQEAEPILQVEGVLEEGDRVVPDDDSLYDAYPVEGRAGQTLQIVMESEAFDTYLLLLDPQGEAIAQNNNLDETTTNAGLVVTLPEDGTYMVIANAADAENRGRYRLMVREVATEGQSQGSEAESPVEDDRKAEADRLFQEGIEQFNVSQFREALQSWEQALEIYRKIGDRQGEGNALGNLGLTYNNLGQYQQAIAFYEQSLDIVREIGNRRGEGNALGNLGSAYRNLGQYQEAIALYEQRLEIAREIGDRRGEGNALGNLGSAYRNLGQYQEAIAFYEQHLEIAREIGDRRGEGNALGNLGSAYSNLGQYQEAIAFYEQHLEIAREIGDRQGEGVALGNLGTTYLRLGRYQQAIAFYEQHLEIAREIGDRQGEGVALGNLGSAYRNLGQYQEAIAFYEQQLDIVREIGDRRGEGNALGNLGSAYDNLGQYQQAIALYEQRLEIAREIGDRRGEGNALGNLGIAYDNLGQYQQAIAFYEQQLDIVREIGDRRGEGNALGGLGIAYLNLGQYQQAIAFYEQHLEIAQEIGDRRGEGAALGNLGLAYRNLGQYQQAIASYQQALAIHQDIGDRAAQGTWLSNIGNLLTDQNHPQLAILFLKQSVNVREDIRDGLRDLPTEQQQSFTDTIESTYRKLADLLLQQNRILEAQQVLDLLKVQELDDYLRGVRGNATTASGVEYWQPEQEILERFNARQQQAIELGQELTQLRQTPESDRTPAQQARIRELVDLEQELTRQFNNFIDSDEILTLISQLSTTTRQQTLNPADIAALRNDLGQLNAVLLYPLILDDRLELVLTTPDSPPLRRTVENVTREDLNRAILAFRQALENPNSDVITPAHQLYQWLVEPLEDDLANLDIDTIIYAPDGQLRYVPLAALHDGETWLAQRYAVNNITARSLTDLAAQPAKSPSVLAGAFADETLSYPVQVGQRSVDFQGLPFAGIEVETLIASLPNITPFLDQDFSLAAVRSRLNEHDIIHFATHAAFVPGVPEDSFILFGNGDRPTLADVRDWSLQNVDLVVLSACETGLGGFGNGEEILGLGYQFQRAGARATLASLWQVNDQGTQVLMTAFYDALQQGESKSRALQLAQQTLIAQGEATSSEDDGTADAIAAPQGGGPATIVPTGARASSTGLSHPHYWAPFILIGNGL